MDLLDDLDRYVGDFDGGEEHEPTMDRDRANRILRRIRWRERERSQVAAVAKAERDRIDAWERDRLESIDTDVAAAERVLEGFMRAVGERERMRTLKLPNGELRLRPPRPKVTIEDTDAFLVWAQARVAQRLASALGPPEADVFAMAPAHMVEEVLRSLFAEPMLRAKIEPAKDAIRKATKAGPTRSTHEDIELLSAVIEAGDFAGEVVPGVLIERRTGDTFGYSTAKADVDEMRHDDETQGGTDDHDD